jgi:hypothetical protein
MTIIDSHAKRDHEFESAFLQQGVGFEPSRMNDSRRYFCWSSLRLAGRTCLARKFGELALGGGASSAA